MLQFWSLVLREGQTLRVFNTSVVRKLGPNIHKVTGRLVKLKTDLLLFMYVAILVSCIKGRTDIEGV